MPGGFYSFDKEARIRIHRAVEASEIEEVLASARVFYREQPLHHDLKLIEKDATNRLYRIRQMARLIDNLDLPEL